jgi:hypothetical protein
MKLYHLKRLKREEFPPALAPMPRCPVCGEFPWEFECLCPACPGIELKAELYFDEGVSTHLYPVTESVSSPSSSILETKS